MGKILREIMSNIVFFFFFLRNGISHLWFLSDFVLCFQWSFLMVAFVCTARVPTPSFMSDSPQTPNTARPLRRLWMWVHGAPSFYNHVLPAFIRCWDLNSPVVLDLCQQYAADAVLVLQRHQCKWVRGLVQETQRGPAGHGRPRSCPGQRVWRGGEGPDGEKRRQLLYWWKRWSFC